MISILERHMMTMYVRVLFKEGADVGFQFLFKMECRFLAMIIFFPAVSIQSSFCPSHLMRALTKGMSCNL